MNANMNVNTKKIDEMNINRASIEDFQNAEKEIADKLKKNDHIMKKNDNVMKFNDNQPKKNDNNMMKKNEILMKKNPSIGDLS